MSHKDEASLLRASAVDAIRMAKDALKRGDYGWATFLAEQASQLVLRSVILEIAGEMPRANSLKELLNLVRRLLPDKREEIDGFIRSHRALLSMLEDTHFSPCYLQGACTKDEAEDLIRVAEEVISLCRSLLS